MKDSADEVIWKTYPEIKSVTKWSAIKAAGGGMQPMKDIIGITKTSRVWLSSTNNKVFSKEGPEGKRDMVSKEVMMFEEEQRIATAVTQAKQCVWKKWNDIKPIKLSWKSLIAMEPLLISFLLCCTYDLQLNATNLKLWGYTDPDLCFSLKMIGVPYSMYYLHIHNRFRCTYGNITRC